MSLPSPGLTRSAVLRFARSPSSPLPEKTSPSVAPMRSPSVGEERTECNSSPSSFRDTRSILVVMDANKDLENSVVQHALARVASAGDVVTVLGVFDEMITPMGYKIRADAKLFRGVNYRSLKEEMEIKLRVFERIFGHLHVKSLKYGINLQVRIGAGPSTGVVTVGEALGLGATWIILGRNMRTQSKFILEHTRCGVVTMESNNKPAMLRIYSPPNPLEFFQTSPEEIASDSFSSDDSESTGVLEQDLYQGSFDNVPYVSATLYWSK